MTAGEWSHDTYQTNVRLTKWKLFYMWLHHCQYIRSKPLINNHVIFTETVTSTMMDEMICGRTWKGGIPSHMWDLSLQFKLLYSVKIGRTWRNAFLCVSIKLLVNAIHNMCCCFTVYAAQTSGWSLLHSTCIHIKPYGTKFATNSSPNVAVTWTVDSSKDWSWHQWSIL